MITLLHIDTSARRTDNDVKEYNSISKSLAAHFMDKWITLNSKDKVIYRDLGLNPPDFISQDWIAAVFTPDEKQSEEQKSLLTLSDTLIDEVDQADIIVISSPMYNYGMPAVLKAWFDQVVRINKTFTFDLARGDFPIEPIMSGKKLILISSSGEFGFEIGGIREKMNYLAPHVETASKYLGVEEFYEIKSEYQEFADARHEESLSNAYRGVEELVKQLV
ncbi:FMN-dependent NADH-azoreductase [Colwellia psychrerythraea]|uniref:FMN-dependent NADH:quinone oxidoreductase 2 n=1 Tax=Colwellia psychrerythraea (strain 34H / ATCC BAA-681) TaxID=167879 RepID=AZOR2_COLP3|nr:NAD(P)H-dependent oxidoreductase [Colwellia psychrerythraea]Q47ZU7.1 RecName: Full=FMN-dependent NADH:quinone oxidoreductase 2; AltName: Full=Azo-dye reductase 2; AltName: Full=FMN-dependent NADH-azo compound oxidoreductase 2; AltName: Full=FMN-dependent NADH-azoreductase 2 [Colwellia psychrerythraea 34H]AAZ24015.1 FMN-dependent NADH-azoreductase [Colwellia psychrerythraea 34H]